MNFEITNCGGISQAAFELRKGAIVMVAGQNFQGKTSLLRAVQSLLTGSTSIDGTTKKNSFELVRDGAEFGVAHLTSESGEKRIVWSQNDSTSEGEHPVVGQNALGLTQFTKLKAEDRFTTIQKLIACKPTKEDFFLAVHEDLGWAAEAEQTKKQWQTVESLGFSTALKEANTEGAINKRVWQELTNTKWGKVESAKWIPSDAEILTGSDTEKSLLESIDSANKSLEAALKTEGGNEANIASLKAEVETIGQLEEELVKSKEALQTIDANLATARGLLQNSQSSVPTESQECPHCQKPVQIRNGQVVVAKEATKGEIAKIKAEIKDQQERVDNITKMDTELKKQIATTQVLIEKAKTAAKELARAEKAKTAAKGLSVENSRSAVDVAQRRYAAFDKLNRARALHQAILDNAKLQDLLSPDGLQGTVLAKALGKFNAESLAPLCRAAGWPNVELDGDMQVRYFKTPKGRNYQYLSASERYRVDAIIQIALAKLQRSPIVLFDGAEILDANARGQFCNLLMQSGMTSLVAITVDKPSQVPDLAALGVGETLWIEKGIATPLASLSTGARA